jgi:hypothetical protein
MKLQSAMEYLLTYGWAILIIAIALVALFYLGVFNPYYFTAKTAPGSCNIYRPQGPGTTQGISLSGVCTGEIPQYTALFNGASSQISLAQIYQEAGTNSISYAVWFDALSLPDAWPMVFGDAGSGPRNGYELLIPGPGSGFSGTLDASRWAGGAQTVTTSLSTISLNTWHFAVVTYDGSTLRLYLDGVLQGSIPVSSSITVNSNMYVGSEGWATSYGNYEISNLQVYSSALSANSVKALYIEGIGGPPIDLQHIVGWWPLNGDTKDYSGNGNNGVANSLSFSSAWWNGYTTP